MPITPGAATQSRSRTLWWKGTLIALLVTGVLAMHVLAGGTHSSADHADMAHGNMAGVDSAVMAIATNMVPGDPDAASTWDACCTTRVCLALVAGVMLLLVVSGVGRPLERRRRRAIGPTLTALLSRARFPDPPDLHSLSILRC